MTIAPMAEAASARPIGRREANKADKLLRISQSARALFIDKGFDGTTMREIADSADVGFGTIFQYASNKRDLLFLVCNPELEALLDRAMQLAQTRQDVVSRLLALFEVYYAYYAEQPALARLMLRELTFFSEGSEAMKFVGHRTRFLGVVTAEIETAIDTGQLHTKDPEHMGRIVFAIYAWDVRRWLSEPVLDVAVGVAELRTLLTLFLSNLSAPTRHSAELVQQ